MLQKMTAEEVIVAMIAELLAYVEELFEYKNVEGEQFQYGERLAYTECLEFLQAWTHAEANGLDFDIEKRYPL